MHDLAHANIPFYRTNKFARARLASQNADRRGFGSGWFTRKNLSGHSERLTAGLEQLERLHK